MRPCRPWPWSAAWQGQEGGLSFELALGWERGVGGWEATVGAGAEQMGKACIWATHSPLPLPQGEDLCSADEETEVARLCDLV